MKRIEEIETIIKKKGEKGQVNRNNAKLTK